MKKFVVTTDSKHSDPVAPNLLNRQFSVSSPNQVWVSDITYLEIGGKWHYLSVFIDLFSIIVVGWDLSDSLERHSTIHAFRKALLRRSPGKGLMIHSDPRGAVRQRRFQGDSGGKRMHPEHERQRELLG